MEPLAVDVSEAARLLSVSVFTIRRMLRDGRLQPIHIGRRVLVPLESLQSLTAPTSTLTAPTPTRGAE